MCGRSMQIALRFLGRALRDLLLSSFPPKVLQRKEMQWSRRRVAALWLMAIPACWASLTCKEVEYVYERDTLCAKALAAATPKGGFLSLIHI